MAFGLYVLAWLIFFLLLLTVVLNRGAEYVGVFLTGWMFYLLLLIIVHLAVYILFLARKTIKEKE